MWAMFTITLIVVPGRITLGRWETCSLLFFSRAWPSFKQIRMVVTFSPTMSERASKTILTSCIVVCDRAIDVPLWAWFMRIPINVGLSSEILPMVRINTFFFIVGAITSVIERTPYSFEMKHVEVGITIEIMQKIYSEFRFAMSKRAIFAIFTSRFDRIRICCVKRSTKFSLILVRMVKFFNSSVTVSALIPIQTLFLFCNLSA